MGNMMFGLHCETHWNLERLLQIISFIHLNNVTFASESNHSNTSGWPRLQHWENTSPIQLEFQVHSAVALHSDMFLAKVTQS